MPLFAHLWPVASLAGHWCFECDGILPHCVQLFVFPGLLMGISPDFVTFGLLITLRLSFRANFLDLITSTDCVALSWPQTTACCFLIDSLWRAVEIAFSRVNASSICSLRESFASCSPTTIRSLIISSRNPP